MHFKMIVVFIDDDRTDKVLNAARDAGATGATVINNARGEGLKKQKTFLGLALESQRDVILLLVEEHRSRHILEVIAREGEFDAKPGVGIAFQIDVEDAVGVTHQVMEISNDIGEGL
ncbi:MAG: P-II family nitrogen regulator [Gammaproteobacteria bacterium]|nr:P-II family nitrogen regulator [Gammaproteobacteria bacterium]